MKPPTGHGHIKLVPISKIEGKAIHLELFNNQFDYVLNNPTIMNTIKIA